MKNIFKKIHSWFKPKTIPQHVVLIDKCNAVASEYGTSIDTLTITSNYYTHTQSRGVVVWVHLTGTCKDIDFDYETGIDEDQVVATFELMLISKGYKKQ